MSVCVCLVSCLHFMQVRVRCVTAILHFIAVVFKQKAVIERRRKEALGLDQTLLRENNNKY